MLPKHAVFGTYQLLIQMKMKKLTPIIIVAGLEGDKQKDQEEEHTREEEPPLSLPHKKREGNMPYAYTPRSPPYPPPEDDDWET